MLFRHLQPAIPILVIARSGRPDLRLQSIQLSFSKIMNVTNHRKLPRPPPPPRYRNLNSLLRMHTPSRMVMKIPIYALQGLLGHRIPRSLLCLQSAHSFASTTLVLPRNSPHFLCDDHEVQKETLPPANSIDQRIRIVHE
eukprot:Gregarina_sp_Poly_1__725@NODE_1172_length_4867_cov_127_976875_g803_i0_p4_GENE_NODE_1172_length_4867_cov_127_976875_g803_i0NODE_1172_length_4867_cov_127_976875_g803_i0_p4_ORF_typecomplete_len140_score2_58HEXIM/PF15313_6/0_28_NODE_1172_length_4867_cov_127_976875_g803_i0502921